MSINTELAPFLIEVLETDGFSVTLEAATAGAGGDFNDSDESWTSVASFYAVWDTSSQYGSERLTDGRGQSQSRLGMLIAYRSDLKDAASVGRKRISYNGTAYNIAATQIIGDQIGLRLTLEDGVAA